MTFPRIVIAALRGGSGKTIVSVGLIASWRKRGMVIAPFKKGPDFIDAGWLALAASHPCYNLDTFLMPADQIFLSFTSRTLATDLAVIEGNRGLFDGIDLEGSTSTSELAKFLKAPVILLIDCTKSTRTVAAMVLGCTQFDPEVNICGVILNRVAGARHESILRKTVEQYCSLPVLGAIPKIKGEAFPERHMGLVPTPEHAWADESIEKAAEMAERYLDLDRILAVAKQAPHLTATSEIPGGTGLSLEKPAPRIGVIRDAAFQFYYPENLEALEAEGADLVTVSALADPGLPSLDGLYIGGGFPETHAQALAENKGFRQDVRRLAEEGLPIYAECGGLMYLGESMVLDGVSYPMVGLFPVVFGFSERPEGHGYTVFEVERPNPYFKPGVQVRGHEFHYSKVLSWQGNPEDLAFRMTRGIGFAGKRDGIFYKNTLATYSHVHALGTPSWAEAMVETAALYQHPLPKK
ncbi:MAG: cobyrinate a,c-diamide synthase [Deltaproteobacteria bacterium]|nr:cobyrinate a,c-diamide synthase [Deltaproteobacteria bacterium]MBW2075139.1 cobyrinate a,c-diamide synthase [Deltaproteobacteria bacterium]RLB81057.1 MAG: cobyrinic acid a,c-diamide synthase [Deltaproteobacteria bacterium]